ncbi:MAG: phosphate-starvation-inducible E-like protein [Clostridia bacterium]|nr:phosphate-starvation-inducible E-like protein [Clostridia bacterium]
MITLIKKLERGLMLALVVMMALVLVLATVELGWIIIKDVLTPPAFLLEIGELLEIFGLFMLVLIGIELLETIVKAYLHESANHAVIVITVAIIAVARKVIILNVSETSGMTLLGLAATIIALCLGYALVKSKRPLLENIQPPES